MLERNILIMLILVTGIQEHPKISQIASAKMHQNIPKLIWWKIFGFGKIQKQLIIIGHRIVLFLFLHSIPVLRSQFTFVANVADEVEKFLSK